MGKQQQIKAKSRIEYGQLVQKSWWPPGEPMEPCVKCYSAVPRGIIASPKEEQGRKGP